MKIAFINALTELAKNDKDVVLVTGDLGFGTFETFEEKFPGQYFNVGIAEQSMIGIASGLAKAGKKVFVYSIGNFVTLRCLEQIRNDACYHNLNVNLVSQGGGFTYGALGMSHHATEDLGIMRMLPNVTICAPSNAVNTYEAVFQLVDIEGVGYLRLEKSTNNEFQVLPLTISKPNLIKSGSNILLIATGGIVEEAINAAKKSDSNIAVMDFHTIKPINEHALKDILNGFSVVITIEEHQRTGGLGSIIAEVIVDHNIKCKLIRMGIDDELISIVGDQQYLRKMNGIDTSSILTVINNSLTGKYF
ncbi:MAG: transketolase [Saccharospirillaceae bacterium]|nr:transketolase [Saccharospirillaceae bacterium]